jgi:GGDEF domain-containing protein
MSAGRRDLDSTRVTPDLRSQASERDPLTGFLTRAGLMLHLAEAVAPGSEPSVFAVFGLGGLDEHENVHGLEATNALIVRLAGDFGRMVRPEGVCYAPRRREFCAIFELPVVDASPILASAAIALRRESALEGLLIAFGIAVLPEQADDPIRALVVADRNLIQARKTQRRNRAALR